MPHDAGRSKPILAVIALDIRRDSTIGFTQLTRFQTKVYYRHASYGDLADDEYTSDMVQLHSMFDILGHLWRVRPDVVQVLEPFSLRYLPLLYFICLWCVILRLRYFMAVFENRPLAVKHGPIASRILTMALAPIFEHTGLFICQNEGAVKNVLSVGNYLRKIKRMMYGTWGVDINEFSPDGRDGTQFSASKVVLYVGRLHAEKGIFDLMDAYSTVIKSMPDARLVVVGAGPAGKQLARIIAERGWEGHVTLVGVVKNRDLPTYFRNATIFCSPSVTTRAWEEQVGMTNIQAMACGIPVVSTRSGAIPEYVPDGIAGILVPERSPLDLAHALIKLLVNDELRVNMSLAARAYAVANYDVKKNVSRAESALEGLIC